jgi:hypothetical protein
MEMEVFLGWNDSPTIESNPAIGISLVATATMDGDGGLSGLEGLTFYRIKFGNWDQLSSYRYYGWRWGLSGLGGLTHYRIKPRKLGSA